MSVETVTKRRGRPKKVTLEEPEIVVESDAMKTLSTKKVKLPKKARQEADGLAAMASSKKKLSKNETPQEIDSVEAVTTPATTPSPSTSRRTAKNPTSAPNLQSFDARVGVASTSTSTSTVSMLSILQQANAFVRASREVNSELSGLLLTDTRSLAADAHQQDANQGPTRSSANKEKLQAEAPKSITEPETQLQPRSKFLTSFLNDPEPAPVPQGLADEPERPTELLSQEAAGRSPVSKPPPVDRKSTAEASRSDVKSRPASDKASTLAPFASKAAKTNTLSLLSSVKASPFTSTPKAMPNPSSPALNASPTSSQPRSSESPSSATASSSKPTPKSPPSQPNQPPISTPTVAANPLKQTSIPPATPSPSLSSLPPTTPAPAARPLRLPPNHLRPPPPPPPKRPTEIPYAELKKNPEYRRLYRRYTALMVSVPFVLWTSWILWQRYDKQRQERTKALFPDATYSQIPTQGGGATGTLPAGGSWAWTGAGAGTSEKSDEKSN